MSSASSDPTRGPSFSDVLIYLVGVAGMTACLTLIWLSMRAVMDIGGACAEGGPFVIETPCPEGVPLLLVGGVFGLFLFGALMLGKGSAIGGRYAGLVAFAWPILFISLGWNFLEYAIDPPGGGGLVWGWLIPGVIFVIMGGAPVVAALTSKGSTGPKAFGSADSAARLRAAVAKRAAAPQPNVISTNPAEPQPAEVAAPPATATDPGADLVEQLERLTKLHRDGALTDEEFEAAKLEILTDPDEPR